MLGRPWLAALLGALFVVLAAGSLRAQTATIHLRVDDGPASEAGTGDFDSAVVIRLFRTRAAALRACAERARDTGTGNVLGTIPVTMTIGEDGLTRDVVAGAAGMSTELSACVVRVTTSFRFNPGPEGGSVTYTVNLTYSPETSTPLPPGGS